MYVVDDVAIVVRFTYHVQRHIELDGDEHGPAARRALIALAGTDPDAWRTHAGRRSARSCRASSCGTESIRKRQSSDSLGVVGVGYTAHDVVVPRGDALARARATSRRPMCCVRMAACSDRSASTSARSRQRSTTSRSRSTPMTPRPSTSSRAAGCSR
ncbi:MAG: DUF3050 domain-containing protein [Deltaproteobacteria bacterium]|nr:DUF3050 domain-containing protein [Deltaproteobacteria bacterium]